MSGAVPWWELCRPLCEQAGIQPDAIPLRAITDGIKGYVAEVTRLKIRARTDRACGLLELTLARHVRPTDGQVERLREAIGPAARKGLLQGYGYVSVAWWATSLPSEYEDGPAWPVMVPEAHAETARRCFLERLHTAFPDRFRSTDTPAAVIARRWLDAQAPQLRRVERILGREAVLAALEPRRRP